MIWPGNPPGDLFIFLPAIICRRNAQPLATATSVANTPSFLATGKPGV
jgi:hypothetical protein